MPEEPAYLQVTLVAPQYTVDDLVPCGLMNRPELASQRAAVQATLEAAPREKMRPLLPSVVLEGNGPDGSTMGGVFGGGRGGEMGTSYGRADVSVGLVWTLQNLGAGNCEAAHGRDADRERAAIELANLQDRVADEVVQAHAGAEAARGEIAAAETALKEARITFDGSMKGLAEVRGAGNLLQPVSRPQEGVAALQQLNQAYLDYFTAVNKYNRARVSTLSCGRISFADSCLAAAGRGCCSSPADPPAGRGSASGERFPPARRRLSVKTITPARRWCRSAAARECAGG